MGIKSLWSLVSDCGQPVDPRHLEGRTVAIDVSLWLCQAASSDNYLKTLFNRICKLLFYRIKPVFVFDGPRVPHFKKRVHALRSLRKGSLENAKLTKTQRAVVERFVRNIKANIVQPCNDTAAATISDDDSFSSDSSYLEDVSTEEDSSVTYWLADGTYALVSRDSSEQTAKARMLDGKEVSSLINEEAQSLINEQSSHEHDTQQNVYCPYPTEPNNLSQFCEHTQAESDSSSDSDFIDVPEAAIPNVPVDNAIDGSVSHGQQQGCSSIEVEPGGFSLPSVSSVSSQRENVNVKDDSYSDCVEMLRLFGIPYVISPGEAEAQCVVLEREKLVNAVVTDDSDAWLFGAQTVYKNFFNRNRHLEQYKYASIVQKTGLTRDKLVLLALLVGCDYTGGVLGIGPIAALEVISEFSRHSDKSVEALQRFYDWYRNNSSTTKNVVSPTKNSTVLDRLSKLDLNFPPSFPNEEIFRSFYSAECTTHMAPFVFGKVDVTRLRLFASRKLGLLPEAFDEIVRPVLQRWTSRSSQLRIQSFTAKLAPQTEAAQRKRAAQAFAKLRSCAAGGDDEPSTSGNLTVTHRGAKRTAETSAPTTSTSTTSTSTPTSPTTSRRCSGVDSTPTAQGNTVAAVDLSPSTAADATAIRHRIARRVGIKKRRRK